MCLPSECPAAHLHPVTDLEGVAAVRHTRAVHSVVNLKYFNNSGTWVTRQDNSQSMPQPRHHQDHGLGETGEGRRDGRPEAVVTFTILPGSVTLDYICKRWKGLWRNV
ncbi:hypothetical protein Pcinc_018245 [Petrolisthes cinctipes]|uniref:Uncharacterized protein n=1 Tax=Petrolisthes cinctipes TaxID=88211 RepID=A0AAE1KLV3_PETCI|nr:hypothetical protein Pcinc_018245 [Petrolisthes cinctipes]